jgi:NAD-dependent deacetylase
MGKKDPDMISGLEDRINLLAQLIYECQKLVVFTGAGISTESGLPDFRGPEGLWTRRDKGLPVKPATQEWAESAPNAGHTAILELQKLGKLKFLISQNIDNLHLKSGIKPELLAELHGNLTKVRCLRCQFVMDNFDDKMKCPQCGGSMKSSVVDFGDSLPEKDLDLATRHSQDCDIFLVVGSSLVVTPAADMPRLALESGAKLVIMNQGETPLDEFASLLFAEKIGQTLPPVIKALKDLMNTNPGI